MSHNTTPTPHTGHTITDEAHAVYTAAMTVKETGGAVEIAGVRIERCDTYGQTDTTRAAARAIDEVNVFGSSDNQSDSADEPMMPAETLRERMESDGRLWKLAHAEGRTEALDLIRREWCPCVDDRPQDCKPEEWPTSRRHGYPARLRDALLARAVSADQGVGGARVVPADLSSACAQGVCPAGCSHLRWVCDRCSSEGGWGAVRPTVERLAAEHVCPAVPADHTATTERQVPHDGPGHPYGDAAYCGGCLAEREAQGATSPPGTVNGLDVHDWAKIARAKEEALEAALADHTATTEDAVRAALAAWDSYRPDPDKDMRENLLDAMSAALSAAGGVLKKGRVENGPHKRVGNGNRYHQGVR